MSFRTMTIGELCVSPYNVRQNRADANSIQGMAESLLARGQLYPLVVHPMPAAKGQPTIYGAFAGGRRYRAFKLLIEQGRIPADHPIEVIVREGMSEAQLVEMSLAENLVRVELRPYEVFAAVYRAHERGRTIQEIAETNGQTVPTVQRWARLGNLEPIVFNALEDGLIDQAQAKAFAATEDHALQRHVYEQLQRLPGSAFARSPEVIRRMLKVGDGEQRKLLRFIGEQTYRDAGGRYELDLFAEDSEERGRVVDDGVLVQLAEAKLEAMRQQLRRQSGRDLRFATEYPADREFGGVAKDLEISPQLKPRSDADGRRMEDLRERMAELEAKAEKLLEDPDTPARVAAIATIDADYEPMEEELAALEARQHLILPDGDIFGTLIVEPDGELEIRWWWASRKTKRAAEGRKAPSRAASAGPIPKVDARAAEQALRPGPVQGGKAIDSTYHFLERQRADAAIKLDHGLTQDGIQAMRSVRRQMLRAALLFNADENGTLANDYLIWSMARRELRGGMAHELGCSALVHDRENVPGVAAATLLGQTEANAAWKRAVETVREHASMKEEDLVSAFRQYKAAGAYFRNTVAAVVAGLSLVRSANADGYRVPLHDLLAEQTGYASDAKLRELVEPTEDMVELLPRAQRLAYAQPFVDAASFRTWDKLKVVELVAPVARALKRAKAWVHPMLRFDPPTSKARKPESQNEEASA
ncbi:MAG: ParB/RepB/Spo0J family partition protein [Sphingobium sp.]|uniref:ParB/RepB/Spo0J family partition protein n=1 Tax=Sphingobium sp. TaxID=1912891 RepID=UPI0029A1F3A3|nr:ParB/RepB/Spo0J family partition protein [Sphingobium sp.]MDX3908873.1 ParB/RepB/Spo0J family partition protein [Sphingobium sp.]